jgi:hypothetical protein
MGALRLMPPVSEMSVEGPAKSARCIRSVRWSSVAVTGPAFSIVNARPPGAGSVRLTRVNSTEPLRSPGRNTGPATRALPWTMPPRPPAAPGPAINWSALATFSGVKDACASIE